MKFRPLHDRVVVKRKTGEERTTSGLYIPDAAKEVPAEGTVIAVGNGKILEDGTVRALAVKVGSHVLFGKYAGTEITLNNEEHLILREDEILAIIES